MANPSSPSKTPRNIVGLKVRVLRHGHVPRLTQDQLAGRLAKLGVSLDRVAIAKIETGIRCVFDYEAKALAVALNADLSSLFSEANNPSGKRPR